MLRTNSNKIGALLEEFIKEEGLEEGLERVRIYQCWNLVVGEQFAQYTSSKYYSNGTLFCTIKSSMVRNQLYFMKDDILAQMNKMLNGTVVRNLVLR